MSLITKDALWQATADLPWEDVTIRRPDGQTVGTMRMRCLTGEEVNDWQSSSVQQVGKRQRTSKLATAKLIVMSAITEDGEQFFDPRDTIKVSQMPSYALMQLAEVALRLSGLDEDAVKDAAEDFGDAQSGSSTSDSL